ncbi:MAG: hypothetical protein HS104_32990 [Polyangiaceae bacterium]|nr:hypothetical protein [Polyangiaceae bacterium]MCE7893537.1 hypothetical protein [Sorangiineae bacterium PRO1]MCL4755816.1 hypothetical protein [Myxococcales bacterium]
MAHRLIAGSFLALSLVFSLGACGDDDDGGGTEADKLGVGAACAGNQDCKVEGQTCLPFKGGYCGIADCTADTDCPQGSLCVAHTDGKNYCFRVCADKVECNYNRPVDFESNCSANITFVSGGKGSKACVPPS